jgi:hypothetical protein
LLVCRPSLDIEAVGRSHPRCRCYPRLRLSRRGSLLTRSSALTNSPAPDISPTFSDISSGIEVFESPADEAVVRTLDKWDASRGPC